MKNEAIKKFVEVNYHRIHLNETITDIDVKLIHHYDDCFNYICRIQSVDGDSSTINTILSIELSHRQKLNCLESDYTIHSDEIFYLLNTQAEIMGDELSSKIFRPAPCNFTYWLNGEEKYMSIYIHEDQKI